MAISRADARQRALDCLSRFGERLRDMQAGSVRAAGTSTIRRAREDSTFMVEAEAALGHPIEVISGIEEARLIYNGVTHSLPPTEGMRLVMDIGGGSTELILGQAAQPKALESLHMGCVSMTERFFPNGEMTRAGFQQGAPGSPARAAAGQSVLSRRERHRSDRHLRHDSCRRRPLHANLVFLNPDSRWMRSSNSSTRCLSLPICAELSLQGLVRSPGPGVAGRSVDSGRADSAL